MVFIFVMFNSSPDSDSDFAENAIFCVNVTFNILFSFSHDVISWMIRDFWNP